MNESETRPFINFNPRTPCGVRRLDKGWIALMKSFQSTHPLRGATRSGGQESRRRRISIHAPLAGCDTGAKPAREHPGDFNPRTPCGVRPARKVVEESGRSFQSTHPLRGATLGGASKYASFPISIHAPLAGCDKGTPLVRIAVQGFQSTHPLRGATRRRRHFSVTPQHFNPRTPCGVRRYCHLRNLSGVQFQSTDPLRGGTIPSWF